MKLKFYIVLLILIYNSDFCFSQKSPEIVVPKSSEKDSLTINLRNLNKLKDTIPVNDSTRLSSLTDTTDVQELGYKISKDALDDNVKYDARDSSWIDLVNKKIHLYGGAVVKYQKIELKANYMIIDFANNIVQGFEKKDSTSKDTEKPTFADGDNTFTYREIKYNFKSKKGIVNHAISKQGEFNLVGSTTKFIGGAVDTLGGKEDDRIFNKDAIITTCTHDPPHFGIRAGKLKFVPNKVAVMSVAQVELAKVPTPLFLPFGFFPLAQGKSSGLIFPSSYEYNEQLGLGFREIGWYWPVNDYLDLKLTGDIYTRGTHGVRLNTNYKKRYGYTGTVTIGYANNILENQNDGSKQSSKAFNINIRHDQDSKAHPYRRMGGSVNIQTNRYEQRVFENPQAALTNQYSSGFSFQHDMPGTPFRFSAEFRHSQNTQTRVMDITLPNMSLRMNTLFPFKRKNATEEKWTDNIALTYSSEFRNFVKTTDTTLFTQQTLNDIQTGLQQKASVSTNFRLFKYINVSPNINYEESWLTKKYKLTFSQDSIIRDSLTQDTLGFEAPLSSFESDLGAYRNMNAAISMNTQVFFGLKGGSKFFRGARWVAKPNVSLNYQPENKERYEAVVDTDTRSRFNKPQTYSIFTNSPFGTLTGNERQFGIGYGITNIIEAKYYSKKDTIEKKVRLFDNISVNGNYNFAADSFQWSNISITGNTTVLKGLTNFNFSALYSPYVFDENDRRTQTTVWENGKIIPEFRRLGGQFSTAVSFGKIKEIFSKNKEANSKSTDEKKTNNGEPEKPKETSLAEWFSNFNIGHSFNFEYARVKGKDTLFVSNHGVNVSGSIPLTKNWNINVGNIAYDFKNKSFVYPYFSFARDLHCWQMNFTWAPANGVYSFYVGVKSSALSFMKYDYGQRNASTLFSGRR